MPPGARVMMGLYCFSADAIVGAVSMLNLLHTTQAGQSSNLAIWQSSNARMLECWNATNPAIHRQNFEVQYAHSTIQV